MLGAERGGMAHALRGVARRPRFAWVAAALVTLTSLTLFAGMFSGDVYTEKSERSRQEFAYTLPDRDILVDAGYQNFPHQYGLPRLWRLLPEAHKIDDAELRDWVADTAVRAWMGKQEKRMDAYLKRKEMIVIEVDEGEGEGEGDLIEMMAMATGGARALQQLPVPATLEGVGTGGSDAEGVVRPESHRFRARRTFQLARVVSVWEQPCRMHGAHFLVHTWMKDDAGAERQVFLELDDAQQPGMPPLRVRERRVDALTVVNFVVPIYNKWAELRRMLQGFHNLVTKKEEHSFRVIIVDYASTDADVETEVAQYVGGLGVGRFELYYKRLEGKFAKTVALQAGLELIPHEHEIFFSLDVDMELPLSFVDLVRRHTVRGKQAFAPIVMREPENGNLREAWWEPTGVGMVGVFKSDALAVGYDVERFNTEWGFEDWDFVLRLYNHHLDIWRAKVRGFVHKFHAKNDWGG